MNDKRHFFISYRSLEKKFVGKLFVDLQSSGIPVWMDRDKETGIAVGEKWTTAIDNALKMSIGLIVVITPEYFESKICNDELDIAYRNDLPILPILLREPAKGTMPEWLPGRQWVDFTSWADEAEYLECVEELIENIKRQNLFIYDTPSSKDQTLENLIRNVELGRDNPGRLVNDFIKHLWNNAQHEKGWVELERMQSVFGQIAWEILDRFEFDSGMVGLESAIRRSTYELGGHSIIRFGKEKVARSLFQLASKLSLIQLRDGEIFYGEYRRVQEVVQFSHSVLLAYFAASSLRKLSFQETLFKAKYDNHWRRVNRHWDNTFIALCGIVDDVDLFIIELATYDPILASKCLHSGINIDISVQLKVREQLEKQLLDTKGDPNYLLDTVKWLARTKGVSAVNDLLDAYQNCPTDWQEDILEIIAGFGRQAYSALESRIKKEGENTAWSSQFICAVRALGKIGDTRAIKALQARVEPITHENYYVQNIINVSLFKLGDLDARERVLGEATGHPPPHNYGETRNRYDNIWYRLSRDTDIEMIPTMLQIFKQVLEIDGNSISWGQGAIVGQGFRNAVYHFGKSGVPLLLSELENPNTHTEIKCTIIESLAQIKDPSAISHLAEALHHPAFLIRAAAIEALSNFDSPEVIDPLIGALMDSDNYIRGAAVEKLGHMQVAKAVPDLVRMLEDTELKHPGRRICDLALRALITINTKEALDAATDWCIQQLSNDSDYVEGRPLSHWASTMLEIIGTPKAYDALNKWREKD